MIDILFAPRKFKSFFTIVAFGDFSKSQIGAHPLPASLAEDITEVEAEDFSICIEDAHSLMNLIRTNFTQGLQRTSIHADGLDPQLVKAVTALDLTHSLCHGLGSIIKNWKSFSLWRGRPGWDVKYAMLEHKFGQLVKTMGKEDGLTPQIANDAIVASKRAGIVKRLAWLEHLGN